MFSRRQPSEVYRVYGEDELFNDTEPTAPPAADYEPAYEPQPVVPEQPQPSPHFVEYDTAELQTPTLASTPEPSYEPPPAAQPQYAPPQHDYPTANEEHDARLASASGGVYGTGANQRRNRGLLAALAVAALLALILAMKTLAPSPKHTASAQHQTPQKTGTPAVAATKPSVHQAPQPVPRPTPPAHTAARHSSAPAPISHRQVMLVTRTVTVPSRTSAASPPTPAPSVAAPAVPEGATVAAVPASAPSEATPVRLRSEFGFERWPRMSTRASVTVTTKPMWRIRLGRAWTRYAIYALAAWGLAASARFAIAPPKTPAPRSRTSSPGTFRGRLRRAVRRRY